MIINCKNDDAVVQCPVGFTITEWPVGGANSLGQSIWVNQ
jgi:hypothetical protein